MTAFEVPREQWFVRVARAAGALAFLVAAGCKSTPPAAARPGPDDAIRQLFAAASAKDCGKVRVLLGENALKMFDTQGCEKVAPYYAQVGERLQKMEAPTADGRTEGQYLVTLHVEGRRSEIRAHVVDHAGAWVITEM